MAFSFINKTFLVALLITSSAYGQDDLSFRAMLINETPNVFQKLLHPDCLQKLKTFLKQKGTLRNEFLAANSQPVKEVPYLSGKIDNIFYHYTQSAEVVSLAKLNQFIEIFNFLRNLSKPEGYNLYVAEDPISSERYGPNQMRVIMNPKAMVFSAAKFPRSEAKMPEHTPYVQTLESLTNASLPECAPDTYLLSNLILEESNVGLFDFLLDEGAHSWFQVIRFDAVQKVEPGTYGEW